MSGTMQSFTKLIIFVKLKLFSKLGKVAPLIADPPSASSSTIHGRLVCQERKLCCGGTAYLSGLAKPL